MTLEQIAAGWREQVSSPFVPEDVRRAVRACAADLEIALRERDNQLLSPKEAAEECGFAEATIRKWIYRGKLPNEGEPYSPKVRRRVLHETVTGVARESHAV